MRILNVLSRKGERSAPPQGADRPGPARGGTVIRATDLTKTYAADGVEVRALDLQDGGALVADRPVGVEDRDDVGDTSRTSSKAGTRSSSCRRRTSSKP